MTRPKAWSATIRSAFCCYHEQVADPLVAGGNSPTASHTQIGLVGYPDPQKQDRDADRVAVGVFASRPAR